MAALDLLKVCYHIERNGVAASETKCITVACANTQAAILTCMASNGVAAPTGSTIKIDIVRHLGSGVS